MIVYTYGRIDKKNINLLAYIEIDDNDIKFNNVYDKKNATYKVKKGKVIKIIDEYCNEYLFFIHVSNFKTVKLELNEEFNNEINVYLTVDRALHKFSNNIMNGQVITSYHSNGRIEVIKTMTNGFTDVVTEYYDSGQLYSKFYYKNKGLDGKYIEYYENGAKYKKCYYKHHVLHGEYREWYDNGILKKKCYYDYNDLHGKCTEWCDDGKLDKEYFYKDGMLDGKYIEYGYNGEIYVNEY